MLGCEVAGIPFWWWVGALFIYIVTLSVIARREYTGRRASASASIGAVGGTAPAVPRSTAKPGFSVGRLLAFIPLIDAIALLVVGAWIPALACAAAVPLGRWAQRLAAST